MTKTIHTVQQNMEKKDAFNYAKAVAELEEIAAKVEYAGHALMTMKI